MVGLSPDWGRTLIHQFNLHGFKMLKPQWVAGGNWKFSEEQKEALLSLATSRPKDLKLPFSQWSLSRLRDEAVRQGIVQSISLEWLRVVLDEADLSHQSIKTWKESKDPTFEEKKRRIDRLTQKRHNPPVVLSIDVIGPIQLKPHGGRTWCLKGHPDRVRATYKRKGETRYLYLTLNVFHQRLSGRFYRRKGGRNWLRHLQREQAKYPTDQRVYIIQDNLSTHTTPDVRARARSNRVTLVPTATNVSWMNPVEDNARDIQYLALAGNYYRSWMEVESAFRRVITYRNRERKAQRKEFRDAQRKRRSHRRPVWKRH